MPAEGKSPNELLAEKISKELVKSGLVKENRRNDLEAKLKTSGISGDDWQRWIKEATAHEKDGDRGDV
ncbi:MAG: hypothetical protein KOO62_04325 [candidate division Zixibacteria bacterium]|nr:hypothetical protein [candidate division Zixibacteria bacterium]